MALPTYLELVNEVLVRLREPEVTTVNENALSKLIGVFINDSKRIVEDAYNWNALTETLTAVTTPNIFNYELNGTGARFRVLEVFNSTTRSFLESRSTNEMTRLFLANSNVETGNPNYYNFNGISADGDTQVDLYPIPDQAYTLFFNLYVPQDKLAVDQDKLLVPSEPVILLTYAKALVERGEDGGLQSSEAYSMYKQVLADYISIESSRYPEEETWGAN
jgi:hypothetical protein